MSFTVHKVVKRCLSVSGRDPSLLPGYSQSKSFDLLEIFQILNHINSNQFIKQFFYRFCKRYRYRDERVVPNINLVDFSGILKYLKSILSFKLVNVTIMAKFHERNVVY